MTLDWKTDGSGHVHRATLGSPALSISVWYDTLVPQGDEGPRWVASIFGKRVKQRWETREQAQAAVERGARRLIALAAEALKEESVAP